MVCGAVHVRVCVFSCHDAGLWWCCGRVACRWMWMWWMGKDRTPASDGGGLLRAAGGASFPLLDEAIAMSLKDCLAKGGGRRARGVGNVSLTYNGDAGRKEGGSCHGARGGRDRWCCVVRAMMQQQRRRQQQQHGRGRAPGVCVEKRLWALERPDRGRLELRQTSIDPPPFDHPGWYRWPRYSCSPCYFCSWLPLSLAGSTGHPSGDRGTRQDGIQQQPRQTRPRTCVCRRVLRGRLHIREG